MSDELNELLAKGKQMVDEAKQRELDIQKARENYRQTFRDKITSAAKAFLPEFLHQYVQRYDGSFARGQWCSVLLNIPECAQIKLSFYADSYGETADSIAVNTREAQLRIMVSRITANGFDIFSDWSDAMPIAQLGTAVYLAREEYKRLPVLQEQVNKNVEKDRKEREEYKRKQEEREKIRALEEEEAFKAALETPIPDVASKGLEPDIQIIKQDFVDDYDIYFSDRFWQKLRGEEVS